MLYVRQSSVHQVQHNRESQGLRYAMRDRLLQLGWSQVEVVSTRTSRCSAAGGALRAGFERMVAEVCLGKVGAVAAREVSRFARNSRDWRQYRRRYCRVVDTLLIDPGGHLRATPRQRPFAPRPEGKPERRYELDLLWQRSLAARSMRRRVAAS